MTQAEKINASAAHKLFLQMGHKISYPTALQRIQEWGLFEQPTGLHGTIVVDRRALVRAITEKYAKKSPGRPKAKKGGEGDA